MPSIALLDGPRDNSAKSVEISWDDLAKVLNDVQRTSCHPCQGHNCEAKKTRGWVPARFHDPICDRVDSNVEAITFAVFDLDEPTDTQLAIVAAALDGTAYLCHETHAGGSYRLVIPLASEIPAAQWSEQVWPAIVARFQLPADPTCKNLSHIYFFPSKPVGEEFKVFTGGGKPLDWQGIDPLFARGVESAVSTFKTALRSSIAPTVDPTDPKNLREGPLDLEELRRAVIAMRKPESRRMLDTILNGRRITENDPQDVGFRDTAVNRGASLLASASLGKPYPAETVVALLHGSIRAMDTEPEGLDHWLEVAREKYLRAVGRRLENDSRADADRAAILKVLGAEPGKVVEGSGDEWRRTLLYTTTQNGDPGGLRMIGTNASIIMTHDCAWKGSIRWNEVTREIDILGGPLAGKSKATLDTEAANWFAESEYKLFISSRDAGEQMLAVARRNGYDPLRQEIESWKWDGISRVEGFFEDYFGAVGDLAHLRAISRCFLVSCIARVMEPGCDVHTVPVLIGGQGVGKSRSIRALGEPYFTDSGLVIGDKDSKMLIASKWIVELAELASVRNADIEKVKAFVSSADDHFRPPYGRATESFKRRSVFVGTTNKDEILTDWTGNRRWWPIRVRKCDVERVTQDRNQIFAEALVLYRSGVHWHLDEMEASRAELIAREFLTTDVRTEQIIAWFTAKAPLERPRQLTLYDALTVILNIPSSAFSPSLDQAVAKALLGAGFTKHQVGKEKMRVYRTPMVILEMRQGAKPSPVDLVPNMAAEPE